MTYHAILLAGLVALSAAATRPAAASLYYVTYTGTASGTDTNGVFGAAGAVLNNVAFSSTYTYDPTQFGSASQYSASGVTDVLGGSTDGLTDPILSASITINDTTYNQSSLFYGVEILYSDPYTPAVADNAKSSASDFLLNDADVTGPVALSFTALQSFQAVPPVTGNFSYNGESLVLTDTYVSIADEPPTQTDVPEPASFALLAGAACVFATARGTRGAMSRRRTEAPSNLGFA
jgi:hypothetical protein